MGFLGVGHSRGVPGREEMKVLVRSSKLRRDMVGDVVIRWWMKNLSDGGNSVSQSLFICNL